MAGNDKDTTFGKLLNKNYTKVGISAIDYCFSIPIVPSLFFANYIHIIRVFVLYWQTV